MTPADRKEKASVPVAPAGGTRLWLASIALVIVPMALALAFCGRAPQPPSPQRVTSPGVLGFSVGDYYLRRTDGSVQLLCPEGGGGSGPTRRRWCFTDAALGEVGKTVTVVHEPVQRGAVGRFAIVHQVRSGTRILTSAHTP